jgi:MHS family proline/betaine transporter-like MFS transporter
MVIGTAFMALMPSYATIGLIAPIGIFSARLLQGFAVAGEFGSSTAFMVEHSTRRKAFFSSWQFTGQQIAKLLAALFGLSLITTLNGPQLHSWGWRIPFLFGLLVGPIGMYIRRKVDESPEFLQTTHTRTPIREIFATEKLGLMLGAGLVAVGTAGTYFSIYIPTYVTTHLHLPLAIGYLVSIVLALIAIALIPMTSQLADRVGCTRIMLPAAILMLLSFYPIFVLITRRPSLSTLLPALIWDGLLQITYVSGLPAVMASLFPPRTRVTGLSLSYNLGVLIFGGFAPAIFTWLTEVTHNTAAPSFYLMATAVVTIAAVIAVKRRHGIYGNAKAST